MYETWLHIKSTDSFICKSSIGELSVERKSDFSTYAIMTIVFGSLLGIIAYTFILFYQNSNPGQTTNYANNYVNDHVYNAVNATVLIKDGNSARGSGFFISDKHVLTARHVFGRTETNNSVIVQLSNGREYEARILWTGNGPRNDVTLLGVLFERVSATPLNLSCIREDVGTKIAGIGSIHQELQWTVTNGYIASDYNAGYGHQTVDLTIVPGMSGGPIINVETGDVVGVVTSVMSTRGQPFTGLGFMNPSWRICEMLTMELINDIAERVNKAG